MRWSLLVATLVEATLAQQARILLYTATAEFRHDSIPTAIQALQTGGPAHSVVFDATEDRSKFTEENLSQYDAIMFVSTTGEGERHYSVSKNP
jgi:hypothetical protein